MAAVGQSRSNSCELNTGLFLVLPVAYSKLSETIAKHQLFFRMSVLLGDAGSGQTHFLNQVADVFVCLVICIGASPLKIVSVDVPLRWHCERQHIFKHHVLDVVCRISDVEATDQEIKEKSDAWQVAQWVSLRRSNSAEDCCSFTGHNTTN